MIQVRWLTATREGLKLIKIMTTSDDCLNLFEIESVQIFTNYLWNKSRDYFVVFYFLPYMICGFIPLLIMAFTMDLIENDDSTPIAWLIYVVSTVMFAVGICILIYWEV